MLMAAGAPALVAGQAARQTTSSINERVDIMEPKVPEFVRVRALKGFRAKVKGVYSIVNPGDVVTVEGPVAVDLRVANKAVMTDEPEKTQANYLPERKRSKAKEAKAA